MHAGGCPESPAWPGPSVRRPGAPGSPLDLSSGRMTPESGSESFQKGRESLPADGRWTQEQDSRAEREPLCGHRAVSVLFFSFFVLFTCFIRGDSPRLPPTHSKTKARRELLNLGSLSIYWEITSYSAILIDGTNKNEPAQASRTGTHPSDKTGSEQGL